MIKIKCLFIVTSQTRLLDHMTIVMIVTVTQKCNIEKLKQELKNITWPHVTIIVDNVNFNYTQALHCSSIFSTSQVSP